MVTHQFHAAARTPRPCKNGCGLVAQPGPLGKHEKRCVTDFDSLIEVLTYKKYANAGNDSLCWLPTTRPLHSRPRIGDRRGHIVAYEAMYGKIPPGGVVLHYCDFESCANPYHLRLGTQTDNMHDMWAKRRGVLAGFVHPQRPGHLTRHAVE